MAEYSRVKKYESLRKAIETDDAGMYDMSATLRNYNKGLEKEKTYSPTHEKNFKKEEMKETMNDTDSFKNEYLDGFIQEVRSYNMQKGIREYEDTQIDILQQLSPKNIERRNRVENVEPATPMVNALTQEERDANTIEISKHVLELLNEVEEDVEPIEEGQEASIEKEDDSLYVSELDKGISSLEQSDNLALEPQEEEDDEEVYDLSDLTKRDLLEETRKLKVQIDEYKEELNDINDDVDANNRLLNIIIAILVIALLGVIGVVVYWLISGGII